MAVLRLAWTTCAGRYGRLGLCLCNYTGVWKEAGRLLFWASKNIRLSLRGMISSEPVVVVLSLRSKFDSDRLPACLRVLCLSMDFC